MAGIPDASDPRKKSNSLTMDDGKAAGANFTFVNENVIGNGSFGTVYKVTIAETEEVVAIKKVFQDKRYKNRELSIMKLLHHPNIVKLKHAFYNKEPSSEDVFLNVVMDYVPDTAYRVIRGFSKNKEQMPRLLVKLYAYQLFRSIAHLHAIGICHRDIKPQNLLVDTESHILKLCDFGSAKNLTPDEPNVSYICSRYYRAPELIFNSVSYTFAIDVWSAGCVVAEFMLGRPIFAGESGVDQLVEIIKVLGTPTQTQISDMNPTFKMYKFPMIKVQPWSKVFSGRVTSDAMSFVTSVLTYSPLKRPTALEALTHPFFDELRAQDTKLPNGNLLPSHLFEWTEEERKAAGPELLRSLTPSWFTSH